MDNHGELQVDPALDYYATHTGQIEIVRHDRTLEQIVFPIPEICEYLTEETRHRVYVSAERDDQNSKVSDFFSRTHTLFAEMKWQKKLRCELLIHPHTDYSLQKFFSSIYPNQCSIGLAQFYFLCLYIMRQKKATSFLWCSSF